MNLIKKEKLNLEIKVNFEYPFNTPRESLYLIEITANARSWWQNLTMNFWSFFQDVIRASAAYYKWLASVELENFKDTNNPLKLYTQYRKDLKARSTQAPGIKEFLYYYFYYKQ